MHLYAGVGPLTATVAVVLPAFMVIALGWLAGRLRLPGLGTTEGLAGFVFTFAIPSLIFRTITTAAAPDASPWGYWFAYFTGVALVWFAAHQIASKAFGLRGAESAIAGFSTGQSNTVLMGIPMILRSFGDAGATPLSLLVAIHLPITMTVATLLVERSLGGKPTPALILRKLATNPILIGIASGIVVRLSGLPVAAPVTATIDMLGAAAAPCALFTMGLALNVYGLRADWRLLGTIALLKVLVHPALVYVIGRYIVGLPPIWVGVGVLFAACPSGINAYLLAERYRKGVAISSGAILISTVISLASMLFWVWFVTPG